MAFRWITADVSEVELNARGLDVNLRARAQMREYAAIARRIAQDRPTRVLDWGCGWGQVTDLLVRQGLQVEAFDVDPSVETEHRRPLEVYPEIEALISPELRKLPYGDEEFDAVLSCGVLEHVIDPDASLDEVRRVLTPGGTLYVYKLPNRFSYLEMIAKRLGLYYHGKLEHDRLYTPASARVIVERHGFEIVELRRANMLPLTLTDDLAQRSSKRVWQTSNLLARVPGLNVFATNVELVARRPS
jgi:2-polyprenyl-3-methyl-5-hydroxy-6-metoxy-1,4-benzoquinol methylase